jgi:hypothetical protein
MTFLIVFSILEMAAVIAGRIAFSHGGIKSFAFAHVLPLAYFVIAWLVVLLTWVVPRQVLAFPKKETDPH